MKISKLFHWLYAFLLFLPILAVFSNVLYVIINENAYMADSNFDFLNVFYYSLENVHDNVLFSWCNTSFLVSPFSYIGDLFGLPSTSPIYTLLSYWLNISLIWLVFDIVMYVPLLVHRWLDKGIRE